jgi:hypothetical protein
VTGKMLEPGDATIQRPIPPEPIDQRLFAKVVTSVLALNPLVACGFLPALNVQTYIHGDSQRPNLTQGEKHAPDQPAGRWQAICPTPVCEHRSHFWSVH